MKCSLNTAFALIGTAIGLLLTAIALAYFWPLAAPLIAAAVIVGIVAYGLIPAIKNALAAYATCRGPSEACSISPAINTLGQAAATISVISFAVAGAMQIAALAFIASWFLALIGVAMEPFVAAMVSSGIATCFVVTLILIGVLTNALAYQACMDRQQGAR